MTSALGDFCYETTTVLLPAFLVVTGLPDSALGLIEGVADAVASFTTMASGGRYPHHCSPQHRQRPTPALADELTPTAPSELPRS